jgi:hypothetical protein
LSLNLYFSWHTVEAFTPTLTKLFSKPMFSSMSTDGSQAELNTKYGSTTNCPKARLIPKRL